MKKRIIIGLIAVFVLTLGSAAGLAYASTPDATDDVPQKVNVNKQQSTSTTDENSDKAAVNNTTQAKKTTCNVDGCSISKEHSHNGKKYLGHSKEDGHSSHKLCSVENCTKTSSHEHNNKIYQGHYDEDGHAHHQSEKNSTNNSNHHTESSHESGGHH